MFANKKKKLKNKKPLFLQKDFGITVVENFRGINIDLK